MDRTDRARGIRLIARSARRALLPFFIPPPPPPARCSLPPARNFYDRVTIFNSPKRAPSSPPAGSPSSRRCVPMREVRSQFASGEFAASRRALNSSGRRAAVTSQSELQTERATVSRPCIHAFPGQRLLTPAASAAVGANFKSGGGGGAPPSTAEIRCTRGCVRKEIERVPRSSPASFPSGDAQPSPRSSSRMRARRLSRAPVSTFGDR